MRQEITHEILGKIVYEENSLSGAKTIYINDVLLQKVSKSTYKGIIDGEEQLVYVSGSVFTGLILRVNDINVQVVPKTMWYEYVMFLIPFVLIMIWSNVVALFEIIPVIGGAIGGGISGLFGVVGLFIAKKTNNVLYKLLIALATTAIVFGVCAALGYAFVGLVTGITN